MVLIKSLENYHFDKLVFHSFRKFVRGYSIFKHIVNLTQSVYLKK